MELKDKKTRITFHNGVLTIGGTIIEIAYEDSHIFFDFGSEYNPCLVHQPTDLKGLLDEHLLPELENVYDPALYPHRGADSFKNSAVFLSHVHLDHTKAINFLDANIPLYASKITKKLLEALNVNDDFLFPFVDDRYSTVREIIGLDFNETVEIGKIKVTLLSVDHDAYGASGLLIETPDEKIAYTGDIRLHGYRKSDTLRFCEIAHHVDILLIEGVSVSFQELNDERATDKIQDERTLLSEVLKVIEENPKRQLTFNYYISNLERILKIIEGCTRTLVLNDYYAYVLKQVCGKEVAYYSLDNKDYGLNPSLRIAFEDLLADETKFFWQLEGEAYRYLDQLKPSGIYIHSDAQPLGEHDPKYQPFMDEFKKRGIEVKVLSCSGHAHPYDLIRIIDLIGPKLLAPIHSLHPERLINRKGKRILPEKKQTI